MMELGHMPDTTERGLVQSRWTPGAPEEVRFLGMSAGIKPKESVPVTAYRCSKCGYLELYASPA
ncbi:MAG: hypothetical protein JWN79_2059 [Gemmatimonadetes bacterium]|jgi:hypothetical protein|nr:hypothetical protein [Gemmatimonadota bacterium]